MYLYIYLSVCLSIYVLPVQFLAYHKFTGTTREEDEKRNEIDYTGKNLPLNRGGGGSHAKIGKIYFKRSLDLVLLFSSTLQNHVYDKSFHDSICFK